ncbi:hypothetical protein BHU24_19780 [Bacillus pseudomycoides]|uniref:Alpha/beta hydrolase n=1 Tax=Bacillus pseudomycoides TaxID=64104 RepID=A0AAJ3R5U2_9BACI|nr:MULTISPECIES: alpha/beta hydrolase [Bacillus]EEM02272.1 hypothetical protein bmyco0002_53890 [Bacillus pseudomycoides]MBD5796284.1 hypothetical protein [Bacillus pseudomycoides]MCR8855764.1 alpha/beta hydrolase [Bacillus pseudomycoides]MDR4328842.1 alpha/beta hydrolase [Bacillus pseudomycoides]MED1477596.1 alpha/beta hydrolase [Bacillus pseudomycoides]
MNNNQSLSTLNAETVQTSYVEAGGIRFAYRKFGVESEVPLVFCQRFRGTMEDWDPALVNEIAKERTIILFDNAGVGLSSGVTPNRVPEMAKYAITFIEALGLKQVDILGFSMGGMIAQYVTLNRPDLVRRMILSATGPGAGEGIEGSREGVFEVMTRPVHTEEDFLFMFFDKTETSKSLGREYLKRLTWRKEDRSPLVSSETMKAQLEAIIRMVNPSEEDTTFPRLNEIKQPVLIANGNKDIMIPTINSYIMSQKIENAQLIIYPDSGHGFLFQYPESFAEQISIFLR